LGEPDGLRALMLMGSNPAVSSPDSKRIEARIAALDFLMVSDIFLSETAEMADVVLPAAQWAEEEGTMTNLEGRVLLRRRAVDPPGDVRTDAEALTAIAEKLGRGEFFTSDPRAIFDELRRASAGGAADYSGITYERIAAENGVFWPCPEVGERNGDNTPIQSYGHGTRSTVHPGTPRMFLDRFATPDGRARFHAIKHRPAAEEPDAEYPFYLTTGRVMAQYQSGTQTRRVATLNDAAPNAFVEIHPALAGRLGIVDGEFVTLTTRRGSAQVKAKVTGTIRPDTLFVPFHWAGSARANLMTNTALDPTSRMPEFKVCAVKIERIGNAPEIQAG
jgi:assimilatory nitrate reductase catalytic subunit